MHPNYETGVVGDVVHPLAQRWTALGGGSLDPIYVPFFWVSVWVFENLSIFFLMGLNSPTRKEMNMVYICRYI